MKSIRLLTVFVVLLALLTACGPAEEAILTVEGQEYSQSDLEALGLTAADYTNNDGETTSYEGVSLVALLEDASAIDGETLSFTASDGYTVDMVLEEALSCGKCIIAFDEGSLRVVLPDFSSKLQVKDLIDISVE